MQAIEIARRMAELGQQEEAQTAYTLLLNEGGTPMEEFEAAAYILQSGGDYKISYTAFLRLYQQGQLQGEALSVLTAAFYEPNRAELAGRYRRNCKLLKKYPYLFRKDFPDFEELPIRFYPFDGNGYIPFYPAEGRFGEYIDFKNPVVSRNFFKNLDNPILADDVYSQYELEYLNDNVRPSEYIGRENHIYLHYSSWESFCAYLTCLNLRPLVKSEKVVFLFEDEISRYPIDFQKEFGIDYSRFPVRPLGIREIHRLIWAAQLSSHNGGDFFNEIFDSHPNLIALPSIFMDKVESELAKAEEQLRSMQDELDAQTRLADWHDPGMVRSLYRMHDRTAKDIMVAVYLRERKKSSPFLDEGARIAPALFYQPHFGNIYYSLHVDEKKRTVLNSEQYEQIRSSPVFRNFKYIKTFTPMRRITSSYAATVKFMRTYKTNVDAKTSHMGNAILVRVLNRSFMIDRDDRLHRDSVLVRFEDGKLNPKATFTALAAFLDLPYTESMTYCSLYGKRDPESLSGNDLGFSPAAIYRTNDAYANDAERAYLEYFMRDAYEYYGYDFHYYKGQPVDDGQVEAWLSSFTTLDHYMDESMRRAFRNKVEELHTHNVTVLDVEQEFIEEYIQKIRSNRQQVTEILRSGLRFVNKDGQPLQMMPRLALDPALLEQPLYR